MITLMEAGGPGTQVRLCAEHSSQQQGLWVTSGVMNSDAQSSHYGGSSNGPWNKIMTLMERMMTAANVGSLVMAFRTGYAPGDEAEALRGRCGPVCRY